MSTIRVTCPLCSFSRDLPGEKVPDRSVRVTCPKCKENFEFLKPPASAAIPESRPAPSVSPPSPAALPLQPLPKPAPNKPAVQSPKRVLPSAPPRNSKAGGSGRNYRRALLLSGLLIVVAGAGIYLYGNPLSLLKMSGSTGGRQIITIPPPTGELPAGLPQGAGPSGAAAPGGGTGITPTIEIGPATGTAMSGSSLRATDLSIFIYAVNAPGTIRVNGREFKVIESEPDMQYNINSFGDHFQVGTNTIDFDVTPRPGEGRSLSPNIHMKVSQGGRVLGEWRLSDKEGWPRSVTVEIPEGKSP